LPFQAKISLCTVPNVQNQIVKTSSFAGPAVRI
jgi:hypothetical protein